MIDLAGAVSEDLILWEKELMSYKEPLRAPETYNLDGILKKIQEANTNHPSEYTRRANTAKQAPYGGLHSCPGRVRRHVRSW